MKKFKIHTGTCPVMEINRQNYEDLLPEKGRGDYVVTLKDGRKRTLAICPACDNPIQLHGIYVPLQNKAPYGSHYDKPQFLAPYNEHNYRYCPYALHSYINYKEYGYRDSEEDYERQTYYTLRDNFDKALYILKQDTGIYITETFAEEMLKSYVANRKHMYIDAFSYNVPWFLMYSPENYNLYGKLIRKDIPEIEALKQIKGIKLEPYKDKYYKVLTDKKTFLSMSFRLSNFTRAYSEDYINEKMIFSVIVDYKVISKREIPINEYRFVNLISSEKAKGFEDKNLQDLAYRMMPDLTAD